MGFNVDLNPKKSNMDLGDLLKMDSYIGRTKKPVAAPVKSSSTDVGVPLKFGNNYQSGDQADQD